MKKYISRELIFLAICLKFIFGLNCVYARRCNAPPVETVKTFETYQSLKERMESDVYLWERMKMIINQLPCWNEPNVTTKAGCLEKCQDLATCRTYLYIDGTCEICEGSQQENPNATEPHNDRCITANFIFTHRQSIEDGRPTKGTEQPTTRILSTESETESVTLSSMNTYMLPECPAGTRATSTTNENAQFDFVMEGLNAGNDASAALINTNQNSLAVPNGNILRLTPGCDTEQEVFVTEFALDVMYVSKVTVAFEMVDGQEKEEFDSLDTSFRQSISRVVNLPGVTSIMFRFESFNARVSNLVVAWCCEPEEYQCTPISLISGSQHSIPDSALSASSAWANMDSTRSRLTSSDLASDLEFACQGDSAWAPNHDDRNGWIQADLGTPTHIHNITTRGYPYTNMWCTEYYIEYSNDSITWHKVMDDCHVMRFPGNRDRMTPVTNDIWPYMVVARYVRLMPEYEHNPIWPAVAWEIGGCPVDEMEYLV